MKPSRKIFNLFDRLLWFFRIDDQERDDLAILHNNAHKIPSCARHILNLAVQRNRAALLGTFFVITF